MIVKMLEIFQVLKFYQGLICSQECYLPWRIFHMHLRKRRNPLFLSEMPCRYQLGLTNSMSFKACVYFLTVCLDDLSIGVNVVFRPLLLLCYCQFSLSLVQFSSVTQSCSTLCDSMNRSMSGLPAHHQLPEFTQTHVHVPFHSC